MSFKVWNDLDCCIGCGACIQVCSNWTWKDSAHTKAVPVKTVVQSIGCNKDAKEICPQDCIHYKETSAAPVKKIVKKKPATKTKKKK